MALEDSTKTNDDNGPFLQFEECDQKDCIYYNETGYCSRETCMWENELAITAPMMLNKCKVCDETFGIDPRTMDIQICPSCLSRMLKAEKKPFTCVMCGKKQSHNSKIFLSGLCDKCFSKLKQAAYCGHCGRA